jgi:hypothetical protein
MPASLSRRATMDDALLHNDSTVRLVLLTNWL